MPRLHLFELFDLSSGHSLTEIARRSQSAARLFSEKVHDLGVDAHHGTAHIGLRVGDRPDVVLAVSDYFPESFTVAVAHLPAEAASLRDADAAQVGLDLMRAWTEQESVRRGWPLDTGSIADAYVVAADMKFRREGRWLTAPSKAFSGRAVYTLGIDGDWLLRLEIRRARKRELLTWTAWTPCGPSVSIRLTERRLRWLGDELSVTPQWPYPEPRTLMLSADSPPPPGVPEDSGFPGRGWGGGRREMRWPVAFFDQDTRLDGRPLTPMAPVDIPGLPLRGAGDLSRRARSRFTRAVGGHPQADEPCGTFLWYSAEVA